MTDIELLEELTPELVDWFEGIANTSNAFASSEHKLKEWAEGNRFLILACMRQSLKFRRELDQMLEGRGR